MNKKYFLLFVVVTMAALSIFGCTNRQFSSKEAAEFVVSRDPDFAQMGEILNIGSGRGLGTIDPYVRDSDPKIEYENGGGLEQGAIYYAIFFGKNGEVYRAILNDDNPPTIISKKKLR